MTKRPIQHKSTFNLHSSIVELLIAAKRIDILQLSLQKKLEQRRSEQEASDALADGLAKLASLMSGVGILL